jgi:hypothetical protein
VTSRPSLVLNISFQVLWNLGRWTQSKSTFILIIILHRQNPIEFIYFLTFPFVSESKEDETGWSWKYMQHLVGKPERQKLPKRSRHSYEDIRVNLKVVGCKDVANLVMNLRIP